MYKLKCKPVYVLAGIMFGVCGMLVFGNGFCQTDNLRPHSAVNTDGGDVESELTKLLGGDGGAISAEISQAVMTSLNDLFMKKDVGYMGAVGAPGTASLMTVPEGLFFMPGHTAIQAAVAGGGALTAENFVTYLQGKGTLDAAQQLDAALIFEVARSQLGYALNANTSLTYIRRLMEQNGITIPVTTHGDHFQYSEGLFNQGKILESKYDAKYGKGAFNAAGFYNAETKEVNWEKAFEEIDQDIFLEVKDQLQKNAESERQVIAALCQDWLWVGGTSIAIDASTIFDKVGRNAVFNYYAEKGTEAEKLVVQLESEGKLPIYWGTEFLTADPKDIDKLDEMMMLEEAYLLENRPELSQEKRHAIVAPMEDYYGILTIQAEAAGIDSAEVISAYDNIMKEVNEAAISGKINEKVLANMSGEEKLLLLPTNNVAETIYQFQMINEIVKDTVLEGVLALEAEVGHVDAKVFDPVTGEMEARETHPWAVKIMVGSIDGAGLYVTMIATNNGSGHGTEFDKEGLVPVPQVGKISPLLTAELNAAAQAVGAVIAQHGTSGSWLYELQRLSEAGVGKFNIATIYQQITMNVLALMDDGMSGDELIEYCQNNSDILIEGLSERTRGKMQEIAKGFADGSLAPEVQEDDSLFMETMKRTYAWGLSKGKISSISGSEDIGQVLAEAQAISVVLAKENKRVFGDMDPQFLELGVAGDPGYITNMYGTDFSALNTLYPDVLHIMSMDAVRANKTGVNKPIVMSTTELLNSPDAIINLVNLKEQVNAGIGEAKIKFVLHLEEDTEEGAEAELAVVLEEVNKLFDGKKEISVSNLADYVVTGTEPVSVEEHLREAYGDDAEIKFVGEADYVSQFEGDSIDRIILDPAAQDGKEVILAAKGLSVAVESAAGMEAAEKLGARVDVDGLHVAPVAVEESVALVMNEFQTSIDAVERSL